MTDAADLVLTNGEIHTLAPPAGSPWGDGPGDEVHEAVAVRDGEIIRLDRDYEIDFLTGVETEVVDLDGRVVLPGFVDAHTHVESTGQSLVHADLSGAGSVDEVVERLREDAPDDREWRRGFGWDESEWPESRYLRAADLDRVSDERPVVAFRVDMHTATLNSVAVERLLGELPADDVEYEGGDPTGVVVEDAVGVVREAIDRGVAETRDLVTAARDRAHELGVTAVHDKVRNSHAPRVYRELALAGDLDLRVRIDYWSDHLDAVEELGLRTDHGSATVRTGGIKTFTDGSLGGRTAKLTEPYADVDPADREDDGRGKWVVEPDAFRDLVEQVDGAGLQLVTHAIGDAAVEETVATYEATEDPGGARHRIEHLELFDDDHVERLAEAGIVASCQPNFLQWAADGGLYDRRLGDRRRRRSNRFRDLLDAGVPLAFGSDSMPMGPLEGVHHAVNAPDERQRLSVTEALRAYTYGAAYAGFDEDRLGSIEVGTAADFVVLERSPWDHEDEIRDVEVAMTVVDGEVVHDDR